ncbi:MAG TPA: hypothetical protein VIH35_08060 [Kiritimatiellia bacterium]
MRRFWKIIALLGAGLAPLAWGQELEENTEDIVVDPPKREWFITLGLSSQNIIYQHDALQQRADSDNDNFDIWEDGDVDGQGWGVRFAAASKDGIFRVDYYQSDVEFTLNSVSNYYQEIDTDRRELDMVWEAISGHNDMGLWGWVGGFKYLGAGKDDLIIENGVEGRGDGTVKWLLLKAGYFGEWLPFGGHYMSLHGEINGYLGEADGVARVGNDTAVDGTISEEYDEDYSIAYGADALVGIGFRLSRHISVIVDYRREWLYSFEATETGVVVFPDNDDALFIENDHSVTFHLDVTF